MSNLCSNEIRELIHEPIKIDCDSGSDVAIVDFSDEVSLQYNAFGISNQYFYKTVNTWFI